MSWRGLTSLLLAAPLAAAAQGGAPLAELVRQKEQLVRRLLEDSPAAARINASGDLQAIRHFESAQDELHAAREAAARKDWPVANQRLNDAMWSVGRARLRVPDPAARDIEERVRFARLSDAIQGLLRSYARHGGASGAGSGGQDEDLLQIHAAIERAQGLAIAERTREAALELQAAERRLLAALNRVLGARTLEYAARFATEAEEFAHEADRNASFEELIPHAVEQLKPSADALRLVGRYVEQNRVLRAQAQREADGRDYRSALRSMRAGTGHLQRALLAAGLITPRDAAKESAERPD